MESVENMFASELANMRTERKIMNMLFVHDIGKRREHNCKLACNYVNRVKTEIGEPLKEGERIEFD